MSFPFGSFDIIEEKYAPEGTILLLALRSKGISVSDGEPITLEKVIDWEATAKASAVITGIQPKQTRTSR